VDWQRNDCLGRHQRHDQFQHRRKVLRPSCSNAYADGKTYTNAAATPNPCTAPVVGDFAPPNCG